MAAAGARAVDLVAAFGFAAPFSASRLLRRASIRLTTFEALGANEVRTGAPVCFDFTSSMSAFS